MIYIIRCGDAVKIGFSDNPFNRIKELQVGNPERLKIIAMFPGSMRLERNIHARLKQYRINGEWFRWTPEVISILESVKISLADDQSSSIDSEFPTPSVLAVLNQIRANFTATAMFDCRLERDSDNNVWLVWHKSLKKEPVQIKRQESLNNISDGIEAARVVNCCDVLLTHFTPYEEDDIPF